MFQGVLHIFRRNMRYEAAALFVKTLENVVFSCYDKVKQDKTFVGGQNNEAKNHECRK